MYSIFKITLFVGLLSVQSCGGTNASANSTNNESDASNTIEMNEKSMLEEGFSKGYVKETDNIKCKCNL